MPRPRSPFGKKSLVERKLSPVPLRITSAGLGWDTHRHRQPLAIIVDQQKAKGASYDWAPNSRARKRWSQKSECSSSRKQLGEEGGLGTSQVPVTLLGVEKYCFSFFILINTYVCLLSTGGLTEQVRILQRNIKTLIWKEINLFLLSMLTIFISGTFMDTFFFNHWKVWS